MIRFLTLVLVISSTTTSYAVDSHWKINTEKDRFTITRNQNGYFIGNKKITPGTFSWFRDFIDNQDVSGPCPVFTTKPNITVIKTKGDYKKTVQIFLSDKVLKVNDDCSDLKGDGIYRFPLVRSWYLGKDKLTIGIGKKREISVGNRTVEYQFDKGNFYVLNGDIVPHWGKIIQFEKMLKDFSVNGRRRMGYSFEKKMFQFSSNGKDYAFYEVAPGAWAVKFPKADWLIVSNSFQWGNFDLGSLTHPHSGDIRTFTNSKKNESVRLGALQKLSKAWDETIQNAYYVVLNDEEASIYLRKQTAEQLIKKPSKENKKFLGVTLITTSNAELLEHLSKRLQLFNRNGKTILMDESESKVEEKIKTWKEWVKTL